MSNLDLSLYRSIEALADNDIPNPILRIDFFLHAVITGEECNIEPVTKTEEYLYALATGDESRLGLYGDSISLLEEYLEALRTGDMDNLREPRTREEIILYQAITGEDLGVEPVSRIETYLSMLQNAGGLDYILSTSTNASVIPLTNSINGRARVQEMCGDTYVNVSNSKDEFSVTHKFATGEGNDVRLEGSKDGLVEIESVTGKTLVNLCTNSPDDFDLQNSNGTNQVRYIFSTRYNLTAGKIYTLLITFKNVVNDNNYSYFFRCDDNANGTPYNLSNGIHKIIFTMGDKTAIEAFDIRIPASSITGGARATVSNPIILEGDYTNKPIPQEYFEGMKSTFEDGLITDEDDPNFGKYKAEVKVVGKNKFDKNNCNVVKGKYLNSSTGEILSGAELGRIVQYYPILPNVTYTLSKKAGNKFFFCFYDKNKLFISGHGNQTNQVLIPTTPINAKYISIYWSNEGTELESIDLQIEEGEVATPYEPYKESKATVYLDEPLYKDNELTVHDGKLGYWKNCERVILDGSKIVSTVWNEMPNSIGCLFGYDMIIPNPKPITSSEIEIICDKIPCTTYDNIYYNDTFGISGYVNGMYGFVARIPKSILNNKTTVEYFNELNPCVEYDLAEPVFVPILENTPQWVLESFNSCSVHFETNVPISSISFKEYVEPISALKPNQRYNVRFECNKADVPLDISLGGTLYNITSSLVNNITITTPSTITDYTLRIDGQGVKCKNVVVSEHNIGDKYFEGMKSCGETKDNTIDVRVSNGVNISQHTIQLPQPLRGLPNGVQDRIVYLDENTTPIAPEGKGLYLEKNVGEITFNGKENYTLSSQSSSTNLVYWTPSRDGRNSPTVVISDKLASLNSFSSCSTTSGIFLNDSAGGVGNFVISLPKSQCPNSESFTDWLSTNKPICYYPLIKATYTKISDVNLKCYENATVYVDSGAVAPTKTVIRYPYKQPALFSL